MRRSVKSIAIVDDCNNIFLFIIYLFIKLHLTLKLNSFSIS